MGSTVAPHPHGPAADTTNGATVRVVNGRADDPVRPRPAPVWPHVRGYDILSVVGTGGMGVVYQARHRGLNRAVALKLLRGAALDDPEFRERLRAEAEAVARLQHPNIIQVFETGTADVSADGRLNGPFIALEYVDGGCLAKLTDRPQPPRDAARIVARLAAAVAAAHQFGVIHRDLKPANILLTAAGEPKIADFGLAKQLSTDKKDAGGRFVTQAGYIVGTPEYMAPEQACGQAPTTAVDVYALGVILYELLTARVPFQAATPVETMALVRDQDPVPPRRLHPAVPRDLDTICTKCLEKDPARRYPSAQALADDLEAFLAGRPIRARHVSGVERAARWCRRNPAVAASLAGVVATFLVALLLVSRSYVRADHARQNAEAEQQKAEEREKAERWERYQANLRAAATALQAHNGSGARWALDAAPAEHRAWEWNHFDSRLDSASQVLPIGDEAGPVTHLFDGGRRLLTLGKRVTVWDTVRRERLADFVDPPEFAHPGVSRDARLFSNVRPDHTVLIRDVLAGGATRCVLRGHAAPITCARFLGDGSRMMTGADDRTIRVWDTATGAQLHCYPGPPDGMRMCDVTPDGRRLLVGRDTPGETVTDVRLWDVRSGEVARLPVSNKHLLTSQFSPDGRLAVVAGDRGDYTISLWDAGTGKFVAAIEGHTNRMQGIAFSPDGSRVATASLDQTVRLTEVRTGQTISVLRGHRGWVWSVAFSPDGRRLVSASQDKTVCLWDGLTGEPIDVLYGHTGDVWTAGYTPDGAAIVSGSSDGTIRVWDSGQTEANGVLSGHTSYVYSVAVHPDGERVASAAWDGTARLWNATTGRELAVLDHGPADQFAVVSTCFHPAGRLLATRTRNIVGRGGDAVRLWDVDSGREVHRWPVESDVYRDARIAFSPDGAWLAGGFGTHRLAVWDVASKERVAFLGPFPDLVREMAFSPDGRRLIAAGADHKLRVFDTSDWSLVRELHGHRDIVYAVAFSPDGRLVASGSEDGTCRVWDAATWTESAVRRHTGRVFGVAFSPDGTRLACGCVDNSIRLWDTATFREVAELRGHRNYVHSVAFSPDGTRLVSGSGDFTIRVWDTLAPQVRAARRP